jgi:hypothetical protein
LILPIALEKNLGNDRQRQFFIYNSKTAFKTPFDALSKLAEQSKIHILHRKSKRA